LIEYFKFNITFLDSSIAMMMELSDIYNESECQSVYEQMLKKMFALMSDRASVNKDLNCLMLDYKREHVGTDTDLHFLYCNAHFLLGLSNA